MPALHPGTWSSARVAAIAPTSEGAADLAHALVMEALAHVVPIFGSSREDYLATLRDVQATTRARLPAHFTTSCFVFHPVREALLLLHHRKLGEWVHPGGHADGDWFLLRSALRECAEETGFEGLELIGDPRADAALPGDLPCGGQALPAAALLPFFIQAFSIPAFPDLAAHVHFDHVYRFRATTEAVRIAAEESLGFRWVERSWFQDLLESQADGKDGVTRLTAEVCSRAFS